MRNMAMLRVMPEIAGFSATKLQNFSELPTPRRISKKSGGAAWGGEGAFLDNQGGRHNEDAGYGP